jgi:DMSO/TMAO reductase YedYZ molybdopterin-dependent catalytic subunit
MGDRVPPGQFLTTKFPVLTYGAEPKIDLNTWEIRVFGLVEHEISLNWDQFSNLPWTKTATDFHCVTQWSQLDNTWDGVNFADLVNMAGPKPEAKFVMAHCYGGYSTNLPLDLAMEEGILAHKQEGEPIGMSHGWPLRLIVPSVYAWKSAKWVNSLELMAEDSPGFWEQRGYHNEGNPWKEERFWPELTK